MDRWPDRVFQALLRLFPREFRGDFGEQMAADFEDQRQDAVHPRERRRLWRRALLDVLRRAPAEHLDVLRQDAAFALRMILRAPGTAFAIVTTVAVGVGATTAVFTLADPMLFRPLPYPESDRLVRISARSDRPFPALHVPDFLQLEESHRGFEAVAAFNVSHTGPIAGRAEEAFAYQVTRGFFDVLRVRPFLGREFLPEEYQVNAGGDAAILTYGFWRTAFGADPAAVGGTFDFGGSRPRRLRVVGVLPREFVLPDHVNRPPDFFLAFAPDPALAGNPYSSIGPIGRLAPGVTGDAAAAELEGILRAIEQAFPQYARSRQPVVRSLQAALFGSVRTPLLMLLGATACVLMLACANLAHLFLARLQARRREFGVRLALGAGRWRLVRLLTIESALYAALGGAAALASAQWIFDLIIARTPEFSHVYRLLPARVDLRVTLFAAALAGVALLIAGALPALRASRLDVRDALADGGASTAGPRRSRASGTLVMLQSAVAMALVVIGALLVHSFARLAWQPLGFEPHAVSTLGLTLPEDEAADAATRIAVRRRLYDHLRDRLQAPVTVAGGWPGMTLPGVVARPGAGEDAPRPIAYPAAGTFAEVFGLRLLGGRFHTDAEAFGDAPVAVVDRRAAERLWPGEDPLGRVVVDGSGAERQVIGVVETLRTHLTNDEMDGTVFVPFGHAPRFMDVAIRVGERGPSLDEIQSAIQEAAPGARATLWPFRPFERTLGQPRFLAALLGTLNVITLILAAVGIFGVVNHGASRRTREIGIRLALGATAARIRRMVVTGALAPAALGMAAGAGIALWWTPALQSLLFGIEPSDPLTYAAAAAIVTLVVIAGSLLPAWRVSRVPPTSALRAE
jgi:predicted permease